MKHMNFITRLICFVVIAATLFHYNQVAQARQDIVDANEARIEEVEAYNESIMAAETASPWADGTYEGTGTGFGGDVVVSVTITDGSIASVDIVSADDEDATYFNMAKALTETIVKKQSTDVDTVSGATFSSHGILDAAADALDKAVK